MEDVYLKRIAVALEVIMTSLKNLEQQIASKSETRDVDSDVCDGPEYEYHEPPFQRIVTPDRVEITNLKDGCKIRDVVEYVRYMYEDDA